MTTLGASSPGGPRAPGFLERPLPEMEVRPFGQRLGLAPGPWSVELDPSRQPHRPGRNHRAYLVLKHVRRRVLADWCLATGDPLSPEVRAVATEALWNSVDAAGGVLAWPGGAGAAGRWSIVSPPVAGTEYLQGVAADAVQVGVDRRADGLRVKSLRRLGDELRRLGDPTGHVLMARRGGGASLRRLLDPGPAGHAGLRLAAYDYTADGAVEPRFVDDQVVGPSRQDCQEGRRYLLARAFPATRNPTVDCDAVVVELPDCVDPGERHGLGEFLADHPVPMLVQGVTHSVEAGGRLRRGFSNVLPGVVVTATAP